MGKGDWMKYNCIYYWHHFIDLGNGYIVERSKKFAGVYKEAFPYHKDCSIVKYGNSDTAETALNRIGERGYDLVFKNCEHFCSEVFDGRKRSRQVEKLQKIPHFYPSSEGISFTIPISLPISCKIF